MRICCDIVIQLFVFYWCRNISWFVYHLVYKTIFKLSVKKVTLETPLKILISFTVIFDVFFLIVAIVKVKSKNMWFWLWIKWVPQTNIYILSFLGGHVNPTQEKPWPKTKIAFSPLTYLHVDLRRWWNGTTSGYVHVSQFECFYTKLKDYTAGVYSLGTSGCKDSSETTRHFIFWRTHTNTLDRCVWPWGGVLWRSEGVLGSLFPMSLTEMTRKR